MPERSPPDPLARTAGIVTRLIAIAIDSALVAALVYGGIWFLKGIHDSLIWWQTPLFDPLLLLPFLLPLGAAAYHVGLGWLLGYTPGKWLLGLRVVSNTGRPLKFGQWLLRFGGYFLSAAPFYAGFIAVLWNSERRAWHDRLARTRVVYSEQRRAHSEEH